MNYNTSNNNLYYIKKQVKDLTFGDIILHPIYRTDGLMLVNKEKELSVSLISMIKKHIPSSAPVLIASLEMLCRTLDYTTTLKQMILYMILCKFPKILI